MRRRSRLHQAYIFLTLALLLPACSGGGLGGDVRVPIAHRHTLEPAQAGGDSIDLPGDRGFNIHIKKSSQNRGADGTADSDSTATADGRASGQADASDGGSSAANFTIGHRIINNTGSAQAVRIQVDYRLSQSAKASSEPTAGTISSANLDFVVLDSYKREVAKMAVLQATSDEANATAASQERRTLKVQFEPDRWYDIMLVGSVDASADAGQKSQAQLAIEQLGMSLTFSPPATQPATN